MSLVEQEARKGEPPLASFRRHSETSMGQQLEGQPCPNQVYDPGLIS